MWITRRQGVAGMPLLGIKSSPSLISSRPRSPGCHCNYGLILFCAVTASLLVFLRTNSSKPSASGHESSFVDYSFRRGPKESPVSPSLQPVPNIRESNARILPPDLFSRKAPPNVAHSDISVLFVTKTKPTNYERRSLSRQGWQSRARQDSVCWCVLNHTELCGHGNEVCQYRSLRWSQRFAVGGHSVPADVVNEIATKSDFLLYPGVDSYSHLTWKVLWILKYVTQRVEFNYLILLDDDCFVQLWRVYDYLSTAPRKRLYAGHVDPGPVSVSRSTRSRWQVSVQQYEEPNYPQYAWGAGLILSRDVASLTVSTAEHWKRPWFGVDDAFMGVLLNSSGVPVVDIEQIYTAGWHKTLGCRTDYSLRSTQPLIVAGSNDEMLYFIDAATRKISLCTVMDGPLRDLAILVTSSFFPWAIACALVAVIVVCVYISRISTAR
eukprot:scpid77767/ scgid20766/ Beta-1,3-galactosyltransferase 15; Galactosyltransferase 1